MHNLAKAVVTLVILTGGSSAGPQKPQATACGGMVYRIEGAAGYSVADLRTVRDDLLARRLKAGVIVPIEDGSQNVLMLFRPEKTGQALGADGLLPPGIRLVRVRSCAQ